MPEEPTCEQVAMARLAQSAQAFASDIAACAGGPPSQVGQCIIDACTALMKRTEQIARDYAACVKERDGLEIDPNDITCCGQGEE